MTKFPILVLALVFPIAVPGQEGGKGRVEREQEIIAWSSAVGDWEGRYFVEAAPQQLLTSLEEDGTNIAGIGLRLKLDEDEASVFFQYEPDGDWMEIASNAPVIPDKIAWHVQISLEGGVWLERYFLSFMRIEEEVADFVVTRTVHNWYDTGNKNAPNTYYVFGRGQVTRTVVPD